jgi:hypothetical protein
MCFKHILLLLYARLTPLEVVYNINLALSPRSLIGEVGQANWQVFWSFGDYVSVLGLFADFSGCSLPTRANYFPSFDSDLQRPNMAIQLHKIGYTPVEMLSSMRKCP